MPTFRSMLEEHPVICSALILKLLKNKLIFWLFILKMALFSPFLGHLFYFFSWLIYAPMLEEYPVNWGALIHLNWFFMSWFLDFLSSKLQFFWLKMTILVNNCLFVCHHMHHPCLISTQVIWCGFYCKICKVRFD